MHFCKLYGNTNEDCKSLFKDRLGTKVTPTFVFFEEGIHSWPCLRSAMADKQSCRLHVCSSCLGYRLTAMSACTLDTCLFAVVLHMAHQQCMVICRFVSCSPSYSPLIAELQHCAGKITHTHTGANKAKLEHYVRQHIPEAKRPPELFSGPQQTPTGGWK